MELKDEISPFEKKRMIKQNKAKWIRQWKILNLINLIIVILGLIANKLLIIYKGGPSQHIPIIIAGIGILITSGGYCIYCFHLDRKDILEKGEINRDRYKVWYEN